MYEYNQVFQIRHTIRGSLIAAPTETGSRRKSYNSKCGGHTGRLLSHSFVLSCVQGKPFGVRDYHVEGGGLAMFLVTCRGRASNGEYRGPQLFAMCTSQKQCYT